MKPPLTYEEYDKLITSMEQLEALHVSQNELMVQLRRAYTMAHLVGMHPSEMKGDVSLTHITGPGPSTQKPWLRASIRIKYTLDGAQQEKTIPLNRVPLNLWEPEMVEKYRRTMARLGPKNVKGLWR